MHEVISLLDSDDEAARYPLAGPSLLPVAAPAQARKTPLASKRPVIPDLLDDDDDNTFAAVSPPMLVSSGSGSVPRRSSSPICAVRIDEQDRQSGPVALQPTYEDDDEILICGVVTSTVQPAGGSSIVADEDELIEVVSSTLAPVPRPNARASSSRTPSVTAPAFPLDLQRSLAKQGRVLAGLSGRLSPASPLPCATVRVDSAVAGLWSSKGLSAAAAELSDDENDPDHVHGMMVAGIEAATAFAETRRSISGITSARSSEARADGAGAKRKKYKLDSSDAEDDAAYLKARRAAAAVKSKLQPSPEPRHVKGKGKERSVGAEDSDGSELRTVSAEPAPKRKRKTADEIAFDAAVKARARQDKAEEAARRKAEKELFKEANKLRSRTTAMQELIIDLPRQTADSRSIVARIRPELVDRFEETGVDLTEYSPGLLANILRFKRELKAEYDEKSRQFTSIPTRIKQESTAILLLSAEETATYVREKTWLSLPSRVRTEAGLTARGQVVLIVHGLQKYYKLEKSAADKAYDARVRGQASAAAGTAAARRAAAAAASAASKQVSKDAMEKAMVQLQVVDSSFITRVETDKEMVDYILSFAGDVAHRPYKLIEYSHLPFCSDTAIPKGAGPSDTLCKMLATVKGVTPAMTLAVLKEFGTYRRLMDAYDRAGTDAEADMLLANLIAEHRVDGAPNARYINKAKSAQIRRMLRGEDPGALWA